MTGLNCARGDCDCDSKSLVGSELGATSEPNAKGWLDGKYAAKQASKQTSDDADHCVSDSRRGASATTDGVSAIPGRMQSVE
ncbi:hypothetical protein PG997_005007 [Apiospora hydei]|uniref:Uncharacterized protein n=1 Tax=Apiospora hydei TaxID=1337664 RepID=A0ABR1X3R8_9PEZI